MRMVLALYEKTSLQVVTPMGVSEQFDIGTGVHQDQEMEK